MKARKIIGTIILLGMYLGIVQAQTITGIWKSIDDTDNVEKSHIEIFEHNGAFHGKVIELLEGADLKICESCTGDKKNAPITGMVILEDMKAHKDYWKDGRILDPATGKTYKCYIELQGEDKLKLRGYIGLPALGRTQYWYRVK